MVKQTDAKNNDLILAIDTSCDDTSVAIVAGRRILANVISSQVELHKKFGGVMPGLAKLEHAKRIDAVVSEALLRAHCKLEDLTAIAVTQGPGLAIALEIGIKKAKELALELKIPLIPINHMEAHFFSAFAQNSFKKGSKLTDQDYQETIEHKLMQPLLSVLISGGHSELVSSQGVGNYQKICQTLDDACGECFDKTARMLGLGYPGGVVLSELADQARITGWTTKLVNTSKGQRIFLTTPADFHLKMDMELSLPIPLSKTKDLAFSYSGLKTAFWQLLNRLENDGKLDPNLEQTLEVNWHFPKELYLGLALLLEVAAIQHLEDRLELVLEKFPVSKILLGGGVVNNTYARKQLRAKAAQYQAKVFTAYSDKLFGDNAAMIGIVAAMYWQKGENYLTSPEEIMQIERKPGWSLTEISK